MDASEVYLKAMMSLIARQTFSSERLAQIVSPNLHKKTLEAFNLCDGSRTQSEIAAYLKIDPAQFSKTVKRWVDEGAAIRVTQQGAVRPVHVYPIADRFFSKSSKKAA